MTNKRYTDEEIVKALECCLCDNSECLQCQNKELCKIECDELATKAIDLIISKIEETDRLKAEIGRLQKEVNLVSIQFQDLQEETDEIKSKAYKEFANKLEEKCGIFTPLGVNWIEEVKAVRVSDIDKILKEMVGE